MDALIGLFASGLLFILIVLVGSKVRQNNACKHKWKQIKTTDHYDISYGMSSYMYTTVRCSCEKCGALTVFKLKG